MDLFVCGSNPLLSLRQPLACVRRRRQFSNYCAHVPSKEVSVDDEQHKVCPLTVLRPIRVLAAKKHISIVSTEAQNLIEEIDKNDRSRMLWAADAKFDIDRDLGDQLLGAAAADQAPVIQDFWANPDYSTIDMELALFSDEPWLVPLGIVSRTGAICSIEQQHPPRITELTDPSHRKPFSHVIIRRELNHGQGDTWPSVVFPEQPRRVYRLRSVSDLLSWLTGASVAVREIVFTTDVEKLLTCASSMDCLALTADGGVYGWYRGSSAGARYQCTLKEAMQRNPSTEAETPHVILDRTTTRERRWSVFYRLPLPPVKQVTAGTTLGAAISTHGILYIFLTRPLRSDHGGQCLEPHLADLHDTQHGIYATSAAYEPRQARLPSTGSDGDTYPVAVVDVAVGDNHIVALTAEGKIYTAGEGCYGQLGIGDKQFALHAQRHHLNEADESYEFAEEWQELEIEGENLVAREDHANMERRGGRTSRVRQVGAGANSTLIVLAESPQEG